MTTKVKFLRDENVEAQGKVVDKFKDGRTYELSPESAERWIRRGAAEPVADKASKNSASKKKTSKK